MLLVTSIPSVLLLRHKASTYHVKRYGYLQCVKLRMTPNIYD